MRRSCLDLDAPVGLELLADARVDVAIGPDDEVELVDLGLRRHRPRSGLRVALPRQHEAGRAGHRSSNERAAIDAAVNLIVHGKSPVSPRRVSMSRARRVPSRGSA